MNMVCASVDYSPDKIYDSQKFMFNVNRINSVFIVL